MFMQRFTGTKVRVVAAKDGTVYRIDPPTKEHEFWNIRWTDHRLKEEKSEKFTMQFDEHGNDLGRKAAQDFLQARR